MKIPSSPSSLQLTEQTGTARFSCARLRFGSEPNCPRVCSCHPKIPVPNPASTHGSPNPPRSPPIPFPALLCSQRRKGSNQGKHSWQREQIPGDAPASRDNGAQRCAPQNRSAAGRRFAPAVLPHIPVPKERPTAGQEQHKDCESWVHPAAGDDKAALAAVAAAGNGCHLSGATGTCPKPARARRVPPRAPPAQWDQGQRTNQSPWAN